MNDFCARYIRHTLMTLAAKCIGISLQQGGMTRPVRLMAGHAPAPEGRFVDAGHSQPFICFVMAVGTESLVSIHCQARVIRPVGTVAAQAISILEWRVDYGTPVRLTWAGMALETELTGIGGQKMSADQTVRLVAVQTILLDRRVTGGLVQFIADIVVAFEADLPAGCLEQRGSRRAVRRMTFEALRVAHRIVHTLGSNVRPIVTVDTHSPRVGIEQRKRFGSVGTGVAGRTISFGHGIMIGNREELLAVGRVGGMALATVARGNGVAEVGRLEGSTIGVMALGA
jgi:hypothetical protein